jgi:hypothetical protein
MKELARIAGPLLIFIGGIFLLVGLVSFFRAFGTHELPTNFWCAFIGLPMLGFGVTVTKFAYLNKISNFLENETHDAVGNIVKNIGSNLNVSGTSAKTEIVRCQKCNASNKSSAKFCNECGSSIQKSVPCKHCNELNDADAKFCDNCGNQLN